MTIKKSSARRLLEKLNRGPITFGQMISGLRKCDELSQVELAKILKVSKAHLCDIEKGRRPVSIERAMDFANRMGYSPISFATRAMEDQARSAGLNVRIQLETAYAKYR
ncbi:helix-turn-helix domain-containing protein [Bdellovibrio sp. HCB288]|uniref:helix-turn-helix domain-containing protein n=1 Tax=Bdellovibrio sp. HCB288 TaxID=3394355 RepID=UPI0039B609B1